MSASPTLLIVGFVWPEVNASAAGVRAWALVEIFLERGWRVAYCSPAKENEFSARLRKLGVETACIPPNDPRFDEFLLHIRPEAVLFDRFMMEEQFGWRVHELLPEAVRILDTVDLHFLRRAREAAPGAPELELESEDALREIGAIYRSDLSLIISSHELELMRNRFGVPAALLELATFFYREAPPAKPFESRRNFAMIGNFRHAPNSDAVRWLRAGIWPAIRAEMPEAEVDIYGAYPSKEMMDLTDAPTGFRVRGPADDALETLARYRVNLAPLRFGAGIKGKIADGWWAGTPVITTAIGAEGMRADDGGFGGLIAEDPRELARAAVALHRDPELWTRHSETGSRIVSTRFGFAANSGRLMKRLDELRDGLAAHRAANFVGKLLWHQKHRSTKYFSKWIELKNERSR